ncbi:uncharacterized protein EV154DRAFT_580341 [Mucor mucedo]|uniref:uncharacterized protein n=1 Tax=Mucor mucedo TaxID=29922 RepID=UPI00222019AC|nr:uncharacterized protein EV154DRAFT_580341 [Mucor mucedo]KAI7871110.1 hypothetical protein EV154DRAFT_580341 [Mucor mucedo]
MTFKASYFDPFCDALKFRAEYDAELIFGICPFSRKLMTTLRMSDNCQYYSTFNTLSTTLDNYEFLAMCQGTKYDVTPINTSKKKNLFQILIEKYTISSGNSSPNCLLVAINWSTHCDGIEILHKSPELLKAFHNVKKNMQIYSLTLKMNSEALRIIDNPNNFQTVLPVIAPPARLFLKTEDRVSKPRHAATMHCLCGNKLDIQCGFIPG